MIHFSKKEDYAVILVNELALNYKKRLIPLSEVAREYKISVLFLRNLVNILRKTGIVGAIEGKKGGYFLQKNPKTFKIGEILNAFSKKPMLECCPKLKQFNLCPKEKICSTKHIWRKINREFLEKISNLTFDQFMNYK